MQLNSSGEELVNELIQLALKEDVREGDHTSLATVPANFNGRMKLLVKQSGILCGTGFAERVISAVDPAIKMELLLEDGTEIQPGDIAFYLEGPQVSLLTAERTLLNGMQRMSGIATYTHQLASLIADTKTTLLDTRKTAPGMRILEKWAVKTGGGANHRMGLYDMILIKDNHVDFSGSIKAAIDKVHHYLNSNKLKLDIEIETRSFEEINQVLERGGVKRILIDNFNPADVAAAVKMIDGLFETEASGGINESNLREYALTGVDYISMGALTHQVRSLDLSLKVC